MCETVEDYGDEVEMRALHARQRRVFVPAATLAALALALVALLLPDGEAITEIRLMLGAAAVLLLSWARWTARMTYEQWVLTMPQQPRVARD